MGTRATVKFIEDEKVILNVYHQFDGYLDGVGNDLFEFLSSKQIVNGISGSSLLSENKANGVGCLAAQYVLAVKQKIGGVYIENPENEESYDYKVIFTSDVDYVIKIDEFEGDLVSFGQYIKASK